MSVAEKAANEVEWMGAESYQPSKKLVYVDAFKLNPLYEELGFNANLILVGPKGIGKSLSVAAYAGRKDVPTITFDCSEDVRRSHLLGMFVLRGDQTPFVLGPLTTAFQIANDVGSCVLVLEEINALSPQMQKVLNAASDFRRKIEVPEAKRVFRLDEGKRLWIVGTMNTAVYGGVYQLNEDLKSRFRMIALDYPAPKEEKEILGAIIASKGLRIDPKMVESILLLAHETRQRSLDYALSTRDVVQLIEDTCMVGLEKALWIITGKFEGDDRTTVKARIESIFGVKV